MLRNVHTWSPLECKACLAERAVAVAVVAAALVKLMQDPAAAAVVAELMQLMSRLVLQPQEKVHLLQRQVPMQGPPP